MVLYLASTFFFVFFGTNGIAITSQGNYKKRTSMMMRETEKAIDILIAAQCQCEELYISAPETEITVLPVKDEEQGGHS